jgi:hypothetical protein
MRENQKFTSQTRSINMKTRKAALLICLMSLTAVLYGVTSKMTQFDTGADFAQGDPNGVVIDSDGKITLNRDFKVLADEIDNVWTINDITEIDGEIFIGTSPDASIFRILPEGVEKIYTAEKEQPKQDEQKAAKNDNKDVQQEEAKQEEKASAEDKPAEEGKIEKTEFANEHVFAMSSDKDGRLVAAVSGEDCRIIRFSKNLQNTETIFSFKEDSFIFDITKDTDGSLYAATGPEGRIYKISADMKNKQVLYDLDERNITTLKLYNGMIYAGTDKRGLIYKLAADGSESSVLYDSSQSDITAIDIDKEGNIYAVASGNDAAQNQMQNMQQMMMQQMSSGGEDQDESGEEGSRFSTAQGGLRLSIAASKPEQNDQRQEMGAANGQGNLTGAVYKISPEGIATTLAGSRSMLLDALLTDGKLMIASGNKGKISSIDIQSKFQSSIYEDSKSSQVTVLKQSSRGIIAGLSNPARVVVLSSDYTANGYWQSQLIDAGQPAIWGKLQLDARIPEGCLISISSRSGNVDDTEKGDMSDWSKPVAASGATELNCPVARFAQIKIILEGNGKETPAVYAAAIASVVPNIEPVISSIKTKRSPQESAAGIILINVTAADENNDPLVYSYFISSINSQPWIEIGEETEQNTLQWNTLSVPDGIYEIKAVVSDKNGNSPTTAMQSSWISEPVTVDNTAPVVTDKKIKINENAAELTLTLTDEYSLINNIRYTIDSNSDWISIIPDDMLYDSKVETFTINTEELEAGEHIIAVEIKDALDNKTYKSYVVEIKD